MNELVDNLVNEGVITSHRVSQWMRSIDRAHFCPSRPYVDSPQPIDCNQTISAPHMHAVSLELLKDYLHPGARVLDVGSGTGIMSAIFGKIVGEQGKVIGIDIYPQLIQRAKRNISRDCPELLEKGIVVINEGDGWKGDTEYAPFDVIHVGAGARSVPQALTDQLKPGGCLVIPVGAEWRSQMLKKITKDEEGNLTTTDIMPCVFVPLQKNPHK